MLGVGLLGSGGGASAQTPVEPGWVVHTIETSLWSPPSPDPLGITYRPDIGELLTCDSEVEETASFAGVNLWSHSASGLVSSTATTTGYSNEPTGIAFDPAGGRLWISDDNQNLLLEVGFGPDGRPGTLDDEIGELDGYTDAGCEDLEDVAYDPFGGRLFVAGGDGREICTIERGPNGSFDGAPPTGDDLVSTWSVAAWGIRNPEGIVYDPIQNTLVVADNRNPDLYELTLDGILLRKIDVTFPPGTRPSGVAIGPGTPSPFLRSYYVTDGRVDNGVDPNENDGRIYEVVAAPLAGNAAPVVDAGPSQTIPWPGNQTSLQGFVSDDGHPYPPSALATHWSQQSGPGSVSFDDASSPSSLASFGAPGSYVLELRADDSAAQSTDTVTIDVSPGVMLDVTAVGPGSVTLDPPGGTYAVGSAVTVAAVPEPDASFAGFGGDLAGAASPVTIEMDADKSAIASFAALYEVRVMTTGPGTVSLSAAGPYPEGSVVEVTATPGPNAAFDGFGGALTGSESPQLLTVESDETVTAGFVSMSRPGCGIGPELALLLPALASLRRLLLRRRARLNT